MALIRADVSLKVRFDILVSIPGVSQITAFTLLIEMPELGELDEKAAAALCGLKRVAANRIRGFPFGLICDSLRPWKEKRHGQAASD